MFIYENRDGIFVADQRGGCWTFDYPEDARAFLEAAGQVEVLYPLRRGQHGWHGQYCTHDQAKRLIRNKRGVRPGQGWALVPVTWVSDGESIEDRAEVATR